MGKKKGLYVTNDPGDWYSREVLANLIFGPSYVSLEYALRFHGLIPEAVETVTSVTTMRRKRFDTPAGRFEYEHLPDHWYAFGVSYENVDSRRGFLIASPEKALADTLYIRTPDIKRGDIERHLFENLRIDPDDFLRLDFSAMEPLLRGCPRSSIRALGAYTKKAAGAWKGEKLGPEDAAGMLRERIENLDVEAAREDVARFVPAPADLDLWSRVFFHQVAEKILYSET